MPPGTPQGQQWMSIKDALARAQAHLDAKRAKQAESLLKKVVAARPKRSDARNLLGVALHRLGRHEEAMKSVREAVRLNPQNANYYCNLGEMERQLGHLDAAEVALKRALMIDANSVQANNNMGILLYEKRKFHEAAEHYRKVIALKPIHAEAYYNLGNALRAMGQPAEALSQYESAVERREKYAEAYNNMGLALRDMGKNDEAVMAFRRAIAFRPHYVDATNNLAGLLIFKKRHEDALHLLGELLKHHPKDARALVNVARAQLVRGSFKQAEEAANALLAEQPDSVGALKLLAQIYFELDRFDEALEAVERALVVRPNDLEALNLKGSVLKSVGRLDDARNTFVRALELQPRAIGAYSNMVDLEKFAPDNPLFVAMKGILEKARFPESERFMGMHFALGKAYDDMDEPDKALHHFAVGARLKRAQLKYDESEVFGFFDEIRRTFDENYFRAPAFKGLSTQLPVFIIGMPRSGSTLTEQIIQSHPAVFGAGEIKTLSYAIGAVRMKYPGLPKFPAMGRVLRESQYAAIADGYLHTIASFSPTARRVTDKLLTNFYFVGLIHVLFPNAKIVHTMRNPIDTCLSSYTKLFKDDMPHSYNLRDLGRYYGKYWELMDHWRRVLPDGVMRDIKYEDVVAQTEEKAKEIIAFLGLEWDERCLRFHESDRPVKTASVSQVRRPVYASAVARWRRYGDRLKPLIEALEEMGVTLQ